MNKTDTGSHRYDDIINLPHHVSPTHPQMDRSDRAAQFAPFAALTGHEAAIKETARLTDEKVTLDENARALLDEKLRMLQEMPEDRREVTVTYFLPDERKTGGHYVSVTGKVRKIDGYRQSVLMTDGSRIPLDDIIEIE